MVLKLFVFSRMVVHRGNTIGSGHPSFWSGAEIRVHDRLFLELGLLQQAADMLAPLEDGGSVRGVPDKDRVCAHLDHFIAVLRADMRSWTVHRPERFSVLSRLVADACGFYPVRSLQQVAIWRHVVKMVPQHTALVFRYDRLALNACAFFPRFFSSSSLSCFFFSV